MPFLVSTGGTYGRTNSKRLPASAITVINHDMYTSLNMVMKRQTLTPSQVLEIFTQVAQEIVILHDLGIQHRHISLNKIFVVQSHPWVNIIYYFSYVTSNADFINQQKYKTVYLQIIQAPSLILLYHMHPSSKIHE